MKKFTSYVAATVAAMALAAPAHAQLTLDWDDDGLFTFYPEDLITEGGVTYNEDEGCFDFDGTPGCIKLNIPEGQTYDFTQVARIEVHGTLNDEPLTNFAWSGEDPLATLTIRDRDILNADGENIVNTWMGSRYAVNYSQVGDKEYHQGKTYAALSAHVCDVVWGTRDSEDEDGNVTSVAGQIYIDEIVFTKSLEEDPYAITAAMWHKWIGVDENAVIDEEDDNPGAVVNLNVVINQGGVIAGQGGGTVKYWAYADLTPFGGIYVKGTPGMNLRFLFNRPEDNADGSESPDFVEVVQQIPEDGELYVDFATCINTKTGDVAFPEGNKYIHLLCCKNNWGGTDGKVTKFNYIEAGAGINNIAVDNLENANIYNIFGQRVDENYKGLIIKNGKKYFNK